MGKQSSKTKLDSCQLKQLLNHTHFNKTELRHYYNMFIKEFPTGQVNLEEFSLIYNSLYPFGNGREFSELVFQLYDTDGSGTIDFKEFMIALSTTTRGTVKDRLEWTFNLYDIDNDGYISQSDMLIAIQAIYNLVGTMAAYPQDEATAEMRTKKLFHLLDLNHDGLVSLEEFCQASLIDSDIMKALTFYDGITYRTCYT